MKNGMKIEVVGKRKTWYDYKTVVINGKRKKGNTRGFCCETTSLKKGCNEGRSGIKLLKDDRIKNIRKQA